jgi:ATP adenylyltransferase C-terminal domain
VDFDVLDRLSAELSMAFMAVLDEMYHTIRVRAEHERRKQENQSSISPENAPKPSSSTPSYNVVMTLEHIYLFPRSAEKFIQSQSVEEGGGGGGGGKENEEVYLDLSVNSLGYAGLLLVKSEDELEKVKGVGIGRILSRVGMEPLKEEDDKGCDDVFADLA